MPKDKNQAKNKSRFEVRGGVINEFDFHQNQRALAEEEQNRFARQEEERRLREGETQAASSQTEGEYLQQLMTEAHEKVQRRRDKESKPGAAKKAAKSSAKGTVKRGVAKKARAGKRSAPKTRAGVKATAKKSGAKKVTGRVSRKSSRAR